MATLPSTPTPKMKERPKSDEQKQREKCMASGGVWDSATKTCMMPQDNEPQKFFTGQGEVTKKEFEFEKRAQNTDKDPALLRQQERDKQKNIQIAEESGVIQQPQPMPTTQPIEQPIQPQTDELGRVIGTTPSGQIQKAKEGVGKLLSGDLPQYSELSELDRGLTNGLMLGAGVSALTSLAGGFLANAKVSGQIKGVAGGSRALGTNPRALGTNPRAMNQAKTIITAPIKTTGILKSLRGTGGLLLGLAGLGGVNKLSSTLVNSKVKDVTREAESLEDGIKNIPVTSNLGFASDGDGNIYQYTPKEALKDLDEAEQTLLQLETSLQTASITDPITKLTGSHQNAQVEINKQREKIKEARQEIFNQKLNPSETFLNSQDFFMSLDLE